MFDLGPAAQEMTRLVSAVQEDQLTLPTPCPDWTVADLLAHIHQFSTVFTDNAHKRPMRPPDGLVDDWRDAIPAQLGAFVQAWADESAWQGRVSAGGVEMEAADNAVVGIEELTVHGWDLARATGQDFRVNESLLPEVERFFTLFGDAIAAGAGPFGPVVDTPEPATRLQRIIARTGRDPAWDGAASER